MSFQSFTARWVLTASGPPVENGILVVRDDKIEAVEPKGSRKADVDLGNVALIPGLVNAHTHLDLSGARGLIPPTDPEHFTDWLKGVIAYRRTRTAEQVQLDIRVGLAECLKAGTTLVGDIASEGNSLNSLKQAFIRSVVFYELIGLTEERSHLAIESAIAWAAQQCDGPTFRYSFSPHAPYSVRRSLVVSAGQLCRPEKRPLAIHLAESRAELELIYHRRGPFVEFLKSLDIYDTDGMFEDFHSVMSLCDFNQPKLFIHANNLAPSARIRRNSTIVYCPRTHAAFSHPPHPFREFMKRGVRVCLGTDSLASNPNLDILAEARFVKSRYPDFDGETLLKMVTLFGAEALGWADECGSLEAGKSADAVAVPLPDRDGDPYDLLFVDPVPGERKTLLRGGWRA